MNQNDYRWYAVQVRARFEKIVALHMENKGFEAYLPIYPAARQWPDRVKQVDVEGHQRNEGPMIHCPEGESSKRTMRRKIRAIVE